MTTSHDPGLRLLTLAIVAHESPGEEAGIEPGDVIVTLDGRDDLTLRDARMMQREDGPLEVVLERQGDRREVTLMRRALLPPVDGVSEP